MKQTYGRVPKTTTIAKIFLTLSKNNRNLIDRFIEYKRGAVSEGRLKILFTSLVKFADTMEMDLDGAGRDDVTKGWNRIYASKEISGKSKLDEYVNIRQAFKYWFGDDEEFPRVVRKMRRPKVRGRLRIPKKMPSEVDVHRAIKFCRNYRDKFFVSYMAFDGGSRPIELRSLRWSKLNKDKYGYYFQVWVAKESGRREERPVRIIHSEPYFLKWMEDYPGERGGSDFVFCDLGDSEKQFSQGGVTGLFRRLKKKLGFEVFSAYVLRHFFISRSTKDPKVSIPLLKELVGHSKGSNVISEYEHYDDEDLLNMQVERNGGIEVERDYELKNKPVSCPHCGKSNVYDAEICGFCNFALVQRGTEVAEVRVEMDGRVRGLRREMKRRDREHAAFQKVVSGQIEFLAGQIKAGAGNCFVG